mmetsp:Transcript_29743/g.68478  ORF Transcript_29743/g.68478 Transcript_29743/m.68478 type:complete len:490 (+) Transcript_29743:42-1511(+)
MPALSLDVPAELIKDPRLWTVEDISVWLQWLGIGEHIESFAARAVDGRALLQLSTESAWRELGVVDVAQQRVLESAVDPLRCFQDDEGAEAGLRLQAIEGPSAGEVFFVGGGGITGGRHSASNGIVLSENYVSRRHFHITREGPGLFLLQDCGSTTGTFLMVREEVVLEHLMVVQLGTTEITVYIDGEQCLLIATEGPDRDARANVPAQGLFIGREVSNGLCVRDSQISAFHAEVRHIPDRGYVLNDKYSTNRTWLRLSPDGQASRRYPLHVGDLFKVGSTLFHVDLTAPPAAGTTVATSEDGHQRWVPSQASPTSPNSASLEEEEEEDEEEIDDGEQLDAHPGALVQSGEAPILGSQLRWEPVTEGDSRPALSAQEYAVQVTASRRKMQAAGSSRPSNGDAHEVDLREQELSSLQQRMRNSRAQTAYTTQEQRNGRDEDLCKICYDCDIDVVLYPCGHFVLCRFCSQKVSDCPVCRFVITDIIRTFKA